MSTNAESTALVVSAPAANISLEEFKGLVKQWIDCDNFIRRARELTREKRKLRDELNTTITRFMLQYNIEDLNTKEGRIRCKARTVKAPLSTKTVKGRLDEYFKNDDHKREDVLHKVFEERETVQRVALRRLKITG